MTTLTINVLVDFGPLLRVNRFAEKNQPLIIKVAANTYLRYIRGRYIIYAGGGGDWPLLKRETIAKKKRRGLSSNPEWILREGDVLLNQISTRTRGNQIFVGYTRNRNHPRSRLSINTLVNIHSRGAGRMPTRRIVVLPSVEVRRQMANDARIEYNKKIRQEKKT